MKKIAFFLFVSVLMLSGCEEASVVIHPDMNDDPQDTTSQTQQRQVLIEEFTGVRCVNCPAGSEAIENLLDAYGDQLVAISSHSGFFAPPLSESQFDFRTTEGDNLSSFLGEPIGYPTAVVNRKLFDGEASLQLLGQTKWAGYIADEAELPPVLELQINREFENVTRKLTATVTITPLENIEEEDIRLTVMITESDIIDAQITPTGTIIDYSHKHVLRGSVTNYNGMILSEPLNAGSDVVKEFTYTFPEEWVATKCHVIAVVSLGGSEKDVLQAHEVGINE